MDRVTLKRYDIDDVDMSVTMFCNILHRRKGRVRTKIEVLSKQCKVVIKTYSLEMVTNSTLITLCHTTVDKVGGVTPALTQLQITMTTFKIFCNISANRN